jgi:hypothetical protein
MLILMKITDSTGREEMPYLRTAHVYSRKLPSLFRLFLFPSPHRRGMLAFGISQQLFLSARSEPLRFLKLQIPWIDSPEDAGEEREEAGAVDEMIEMVFGAVDDDENRSDLERMEDTCVGCEQGDMTSAEWEMMATNVVDDEEATYDVVVFGVGEQREVGSDVDVELTSGTEHDVERKDLTTIVDESGVVAFVEQS